MSRNGVQLRSATDKALDKAQADYEKAIAKIIAAARIKYIIPFCEKHGCMLSAGMGSWSFHFADGTQWHDETAWVSDPVVRIPKRILNVMRGELCFRNDAGSMMEDYTPTTYGK